MASIIIGRCEAKFSLPICICESLLKHFIVLSNDLTNKGQVKYLEIISFTQQITS